MKFARLAFAALASIVLFAGSVHAEADFVFRYKSGIVADPNASGPSGGDTGGNPGDTGGNPDDENVLVGGVDQATTDTEPGNENDDPDAPSPALSVEKIDGKLTAGSDRIIYQCFRATGGYGNYGFAIRPSFDGDTSWIESADIVVRSDLHSPSMPNSMMVDQDVAVAPSTDGTTFGVSGGGEACIRIKINSDTASGETASTTLYVDDYKDELVTGGRIPVDDFWNDANWKTIDVSFTPGCSVGCTVPDPLVIVGAPEEVTMSPGDHLPVTWHAEGDPSNEYTWGIGNVSGYCYEECWVGYENDPVTGELYMYIRDLPEYDYYVSEGDHFMYITVEDSMDRFVFVPFNLKVVR